MGRLVGDHIKATGSRTTRVCRMTSLNAQQLPPGNSLHLFHYIRYPQLEQGIPGKLACTGTLLQMGSIKLFSELQGNKIMPFQKLAVYEKQSSSLPPQNYQYFLMHQIGYAAPCQSHADLLPAKNIWLFQGKRNTANAIVVFFFFGWIILKVTDLC